MYPKTKEIVYFYDSYAPSLEDGILYHFTSADSFFKILETMTLKSSDFGKLNDLNEGNLRNGNMTNACLDISVNKALREKGALLCFTENYAHDDLVFTGINHPRMWAQYADNNNGVCIAIKKDEFLEDNKELLCEKFHKVEHVDYRFYPSLHFSQDCADADDLKTKNWHDLFFLKQEDWKQENEVRFFGYDLKSSFLSIENSIAFICLSHGFMHNEDNMRKLISYMVSPTSKAYKKLVPHSFAECLVDETGYNPGGCATLILGKLIFYNQKSNSFLNWLHGEFNYNC